MWKKYQPIKKMIIQILQEAPRKPKMMPNPWCKRINGRVLFFRGYTELI